MARMTGVFVLPKNAIALSSLIFVGLTNGGSAWAQTRWNPAPSVPASVSSPAAPIAPPTESPPVPLLQVPLVMEGYPDSVQAKIELKNRQLGSIPQDPSMAGALAPLVMSNTSKWYPLGRTVTVAFRGGTPELHRFIADACSEWTKPNRANLKLDFGFNPQTGRYREWATSDTQYKADIRIGFDQNGYWSTVGTDSINPAIVKPGETSLNLAGFDKQRPWDAAGVATHECGHAIGAEHEHQNPVNGCDAEFRFDDDPGYHPTQDQNGQFVTDNQGKRPGLYTYLGGWPNFWPKQKVDANLRQLPNTSAYQEMGPFDRLSVMKYFFPAWMFKKGEQSQCYSGQENQTLSAGDISGVHKFYPDTAVAKGDLQNLQTFFQGLASAPQLDLNLKNHYRNVLQSIQ